MQRLVVYLVRAIPGKSLVLKSSAKNRHFNTKIKKLKVGKIFIPSVCSPHASSSSQSSGSDAQNFGTFSSSSSSPPPFLLCSLIFSPLSLSLIKGFPGSSGWISISKPVAHSGRRADSHMAG